MVQLRAEFGQDAGRFAAVNQEVIGPFDFGFQPGVGVKGAAQGGGGGHGDAGALQRGQIGPEQDRKPKALPGGG